LTIFILPNPAPRRSFADLYREKPQARALDHRFVSVGTRVAANFCAFSPAGARFWVVRRAVFAVVRGPFNAIAPIGRGKNTLMRKPNLKSSLWTLYAWLVELCHGLSFFAETADIARVLRATAEHMLTLIDRRTKAELALVPLRAGVRFTNYSWDLSIKTLSKTCEVKDGGRRGALYTAVFPQGHTPVIAASGEGQIKPAEEFLARFDASRAPGIDALRAEWRPKLQQDLDALKAAVAKRKAAYADLAAVLVEERSLKDDLDLAIDRVAGQVRTLFPKDRERWAVIFPPAATKSARTDDAEATADDPGADE
jgi:hypothetical protein